MQHYSPDDNGFDIDMDQHFARVHSGSTSGSSFRPVAWKKAFLKLTLDLVFERVVPVDARGIAILKNQLVSAISCAVNIDSRRVHIMDFRHVQLRVHIRICLLWHAWNLGIVHRSCCGASDRILMSLNAFNLKLLTADRIRLDP